MCKVSIETFTKAVIVNDIRLSKKGMPMIASYWVKDKHAVEELRPLSGNLTSW